MAATTTKTRAAKGKGTASKATTKTSKATTTEAKPDADEAREARAEARAEFIEKVLGLRDDDGLSAAQIAEKLSLNVSTVSWALIQGDNEQDTPLTGKNVARLRRKEGLAWAHIMARTGGAMAKVKELYEEETGEAASDSRVEGKGGYFADARAENSKPKAKTTKGKGKAMQEEAEEEAPAPKPRRGRKAKAVEEGPFGPETTLVELRKELPAGTTISTDAGELTVKRVAKIANGRVFLVGDDNAKVTVAAESIVIG